jgi:superfamily II DNA or RNA helicase
MRVLACDECHLSGANMFAKVLTHCNASIKVGTSGTSFDSDNIVNKMISVGLLGPKLITVSKKELMDKGISTPIKIHMMLCNTVLYAPVLDYNECIQKLIYESAERVQLIADIIKERRTVGPILIAVDKTKHGQFLKHSLEDNHKIQIELTHSKDPDIEDKIDMFREGEIDVLVSTSVLREGVNLPLIQTIIYASGGAAKVSVKQWCGRGERLDESKTEVLFFDFFDIGHYVSNHSKKRIKIYNDEQLEVTYHYNTSDVKNMRPVVIK